MESRERLRREQHELINSVVEFFVVNTLAVEWMWMILLAHPLRHWDELGAVDRRLADRHLGDLTERRNRCLTGQRRVGLEDDAATTGRLGLPFEKRHEPRKPNASR